MKNDRKPTRRQKMAIAAAKLDAKNWLVRKDVAGELTIVSKAAGQVRRISC